MVEKKIIKSEILISQNKIWDQLKKITVSNRVGSAYLFFGPSGCGKEYIATQFAKILNCENISGEICRDCSSCKRAENLQHENINLIFPLPAIKKGSNIKGNKIERSNLDIVTESIKKKSVNPFYKIQIPKATRILIQSIRSLRKTLYLKNTFVNESSCSNVNCFVRSKLCTRAPTKGVIGVINIFPGIDTLPLFAISSSTLITCTNALDMVMI